MCYIVYFEIIVPFISVMKNFSSLYFIHIIDFQLKHTNFKSHIII